MSKRILIISDSVFRQTGYSTVAKNIITNLDPSFKIAQLGVSHAPTPYENLEYDIDYYAPIFNHDKCCANGLVIEHYNSDTKEVEYIQPNVNLDRVDKKICSKGTPNPGDPYSFESAYFVIQDFKPDIVLTINDIWGMYKLNFLKNRNKFKLVSYLAVDSECFPMLIKNKETINTMQFINQVDKLIVFTNWAKETINTTAKLSINKEFDNIEIIPHGVDQSTYFNVNNKKEFMADFFKLNSDEVFLIGSVNRNQPRKRLDAIFQILSILVKNENPNGKKFMVHFHCAIEDSNGWDLPWLARYYGVQDRIILDGNLKPGSGVPDHILNLIMNSYDVHLVPTNSEGWGLSILETMACGVPNVISDYSAHGDWAKDSALLIKLAAKIHEPITNHIKGIIDVQHAAEQILLLYKNVKIRKKYRKKSFELANRLQWKNIGIKWNTLLQDIDLSEFSESRYNYNLLDVNNILPFPTNPIDTEFLVQEV